MADFDVTDEMLTVAMLAFEPLSSVLRYRKKDKWHTCDMMAMREAIKAVAPLIARQPTMRARIRKPFVIEEDYCGQCGGPCLRRPRHGEAWA